jgi:Ni/Fe-hydrogenase 1 B-type cytochrome subunit
MSPTIQPHAGPHRTLEPPVTPGAPPSRMLQHPVPPGQGEYEWIYLWQLPLRLMHWAAALSIVVLVVSGFWIGRPYFMGNAQSTSTFGTQYMRLAHFVAGMVLTATGIVRIYWLVAGNRFERFPALFPIRLRDMKNLVKQARFYLFMPPKNMPEYIGHNPMAQVSYTTVYIATLLMVLTGFALYTTTHPNGWMYGIFYPVTTIMGGLQNVRLVHHVATWFFLIFTPAHIYLAMRADVVERGGGISQIISGGKFVPIDEDFEDAEE